MVHHGNELKKNEPVKNGCCIVSHFSNATVSLSIMCMHCNFSMNLHVSVTRWVPQFFFSFLFSLLLARFGQFNQYAQYVSSYIMHLRAMHKTRLPLKLPNSLISHNFFIYVSIFRIFYALFFFLHLANFHILHLSFALRIYVGSIGFVWLSSTALLM